MTDNPTISASQFKAKCLDLLDRVGRRELPRLTITKRGVPVAVLTPPPADGTEITELYGCLRGTVIIPADIDLTDAVIDEPFSAAEGKIHQ
jgi:prevent-host-death family protein